MGQKKERGLTARFEAGMITKAYAGFKAMTRFRETNLRGLGFALTLLFSSDAFCLPPTPEVWYQPARAGEDLLFFPIDDQNMDVFWLTFDLSGNPVWLYGRGVISGPETLDVQRFETFSASQTSGGNWALEEPNLPIVAEDWGSGQIDFHDMTNATFSYDGQFGAGNFDILPIHVDVAAEGGIFSLLARDDIYVGGFEEPAPSRIPLFFPTTQFLLLMPSPSINVAWVLTFSEMGKPVWLVGPFQSDPPTSVALQHIPSGWPFDVPDPHAVTIIAAGDMDFAGSCASIEINLNLQAGTQAMNSFARKSTVDTCPSQ